MSKNSQNILAALIFLVALNLRPAIIAVGPLLNQIGADLQWGESLLGLLGALPLLAFALLSFLVQFLTSRFETDKVLIGALILLAVGCLVRSAFDSTAVWIGTVIVGGSIAVGNVLAPAIVKRDYRHHISMATGAYSAFVTAGSALAGLTAAALAEALGGWRPALSVWALPALIAAILWCIRLYLSKKNKVEDAPSPTTDKDKKLKLLAEATKPAQINTAPTIPLWKRPTTWLVTLFMGLQSSAFYTFSNWLPSLATAVGFSNTDAGMQLFIFQALGIISGLIIPKFMYLKGNQITAGLLASVPLLIASLGWLFLPQYSFAWSVFGGIGQGASLVVALTLIALRGNTSAETIALSGIAQSFGYLLAACGPFIFGALAEATAGFAVPLVFMATITLIQCAIAVFAGKTTYHH